MQRGGFWKTRQHLIVNFQRLVKTSYSNALIRITCQILRAVWFQLQQSFRFNQRLLVFLSAIQHVHVVEAGETIVGFEVQRRFQQKLCIVQDLGTHPQIRQQAHGLNMSRVLP